MEFYQEFGKKKSGTLTDDGTETQFGKWRHSREHSKIKVVIRRKKKDGYVIKSHNLDMALRAVSMNEW